MTNHILKCQDCKQYTLKKQCPDCQSATLQPKPAKYSPEDPYGDYRRQAKRPDLIVRGLL